MAKILFIYLGVLCAFSAASNDQYSIKEVMDMAERNALPHQFEMTYVNKYGLSTEIVWTMDASPIDINIKIWDDGYETIPSNKIQNNGQFITIYKGHIPSLGERYFAVIFIYGNHTEIIISSGTMGNVFVGKKRNQPILYEGEKAFINKTIQRTQCAPEEIHNQNSLRSGSQGSCKKVYLSITADYDLYIQFGRSVQRVSEYIYSTLAVVQSIYRLEEVQLGISEIIVHTSEDRFRHYTARDDLEFFRYLRRSFDGDIAICMGGFKDQTGFAPLGGHAFLSSLCLRSTSYAYINVDGSIKQFPNYSWDVFGVAHELGHVLGSHHTHACVWGPRKNQPLDDCAPPEGSCGTGPTATKGTIMSYCHLPGKVGVSFADGFGLEPGDLIRSKISQATCLSDYLPNESMSRKSGSIRANSECFDGKFTHYYNDNNTSQENDDVLLMSIRKNGEDIGNVTDGSLIIETFYTSKVGSGKGQKITASYVEYGQKFFVAQKYWKISPKKQPRNPVHIRIPYFNTDLTDLDNSVAQRMTISQVKAFTINSPGNPDPSSNHRNTTSSLINMYSKGTRSTTSEFIYQKTGDWDYFEMVVEQIHGGGIGIYEDFALPVDLISFEVKRNPNNVLLTWETSNEFQLLGYEIQKSIDGLTYSNIGFVNPSQNRFYYSFFDIKNQGKPAYYRLKILNLDGSYNFSKTLFLEGNENGSFPPYLESSIIQGGDIIIHFSSNIGQRNFRLIDVDGKVYFEKNVLASGRISILLPDHRHSGVFILQVIHNQKLEHSYKLILTKD